MYSVSAKLLKPKTELIFLNYDFQLCIKVSLVVLN